MNQTIRHIAGETVDLIQRCVVCGYVICDYNGVYWLSREDYPKGFREGEVFVTETNHRHTSIFPPEDGQFEDCKP